MKYLPLFHQFKAIYQFPKHIIFWVKIVANAPLKIEISYTKYMCTFSLKFCSKFCHVLQDNNTSILVCTTVLLRCRGFSGADPGFQFRGAHLKKLRRAEGDAKFFGVFRVKNHDFTPKKIIFFPILGGGGGASGAPPLDPPLFLVDWPNFSQFLMNIVWTWSSVTGVILISSPLYFISGNPVCGMFHYIEEGYLDESWYIKVRCNLLYIILLC